MPPVRPNTPCNDPRRIVRRDNGPVQRSVTSTAQGGGGVVTSGNKNHQYQQRTERMQLNKFKPSEITTGCKRYDLRSRANCATQIELTLDSTRAKLNHLRLAMNLSYWAEMVTGPMMRRWSGQFEVSGVRTPLSLTLEYISLWHLFGTAPSLYLRRTGIDWH